tara:strand:- start:11 stop:196 length:186 start_codon:yes stop_codon:yes gene_type:complete
MRDLVDIFKRNDGKKLVEYWKNAQEYENIGDEERIIDESNIHSWKIYSPRQKNKERKYKKR